MRSSRLSCLLIILIAHAYRRLVANYQAQERRKEPDAARARSSRQEHLLGGGIDRHPDPARRQGEGRRHHRAHPRGVLDQRHHQPRRQSAARSAHADPRQVRAVRAVSRQSQRRRGQAAGGRRAQSVARVPRTRHQCDQAWRVVAAGGAHRDFGWRNDASGLTLTWTERDGPPASPPEQRGFGTRLVVGCVKSLGGRVDAEFPPEGLDCTIWHFRMTRGPTNQRGTSGQNSAISGTPATTT